MKLKLIDKELDPYSTWGLYSFYFGGFMEYSNVTSILVSKLDFKPNLDQLKYVNDIRRNCFKKFATLKPTRIKEDQIKEKENELKKVINRLKTNSSILFDQGTRMSVDSFQELSEENTKIRDQISILKEEIDELRR